MTLKTMRSKSVAEEISLNVLKRRITEQQSFILIPSDSLDLAFNEIRTQTFGENFIYIRLGTSCPSPRLFDEIYSCIIDDFTYFVKENPATTIKSILAKLTLSKDNKGKKVETIIINNFDQVSDLHLMSLLGLVFELTRQVKFVFIMDSVAFGRWSKSQRTNLKRKLFFKTVDKIYKLQL